MPVGLGVGAIVLLDPAMISTPSISQNRHDVLDSLWHIGSAASTTMILLALLAITLAGAAILPHPPNRLAGTLTQHWLGSNAGIFQEPLNIRDVFENLWLRFLLAVLAYNLLLRLATQARYVHQIWRRVQPVPPIPTNLPTQTLTLPGSIQSIVTRVQSTLRNRYGDIAVESELARAQVYAERHRFSVIGPSLAYLGALLLLLGLLINTAAGWQATNIALAPQDSATLTQAPGFQVVLNDITGVDSDAISTITLVRPDGRTRIAHVGYARPAHWGNLWLTQQATGPALAVTAQDNRGQSLVIQSLSTGNQVSDQFQVMFRQTQAEQAFAIPTRNLAFRVVSYPALPEKGFQAPVFLVEAYRGDKSEPILSELVENEATLTLDEVTVNLHRDRHAVLVAADLPGLAPSLLGGLLILTGVLLALGWGFAQVWIDLAATRDDVVVATLNVAASTAPQSELNFLVHAAQNSGSSPATTGATNAD